MHISNAYHLLSEKLTTWLKELIKLLPNIVVAALILVLGFFIAKWIRKLAKKLIHTISHIESINNLFASFVYIVVLAIVIFAALKTVHLDSAVTTALAGAGILGLALAFAFQDIAANFVSGVFISFRRPFHINDIVKVGDYMGKVEEINLRDTIVRTFQGQRVIIPNKNVFQNPIENYTSTGKRRMDLSVGVSYGDDLEKVKKITLEAAEKVSVRSKEDDITLFYNEFGDSSINFSIRIWVNITEQPAFLQAKSEAVMLIKKAYDDNDIMIPFPIRTLDFGIKGGEKLSEMKVNVVDGKDLNEVN